MTDITHKQRQWMLLIAAILPFGNVLITPDMVVSIPDSELPVKLWCYVRFWDWRMFWGGQMDLVGYPQTGMLNNPDLVATFVVGILSPIVGLIHAFNLLLFGVMLANICGGYFMCRQFQVSRLHAVVGGVVLGWQPLLVSYGFSSVITDLIHLWPYALGLGFVKRAMWEEHPSDGFYAGLCLAFGFITCPYNFVLFIPIIPLLLLWMWREDSALCWQVCWRLGMVGSGLVLLYGLRIGYVMRGGSSLVDADMVESVRHAYPFEGLRADKETRFTAFMGEIFGVLPRPIVIMERVAKFYRHFQWAISVALVALIGVAIAGRHRWFLLMAFCVGLGASLGPFFILTPDVELKEPWNLFYLYAYHLPLGKMILEPFRYVLVAGTFLAIVVAIGLQRFGRWSWIVAGILIAETFWRSPTLPFPMSAISWDDRMENLPIPAPGGVVHLPFFVPKSNRFDRTHFIYQLQHDRPIADPIMGFPSPYLIDNSFLCQLLHSETVTFPMQVFPCGRGSLRQGALQLAEDNVAAVILDPNRYAAADWQRVQQILDSDLPFTKTTYQGLIILLPQGVSQ